MGLFLIENGVMPTTAARVKVATGTSILTLLQFKPSATKTAKIMAWGISFDGSSAATPIEVELIETDVAATVTALAAADITKYDAEALMGGDPTTNLIQVGTAATGFTGTAEGTIAAVRTFDQQLIAPINQYALWFPQGLEPVVQMAKFARIRVTAGASVNAYCWMLVQV